MSFQCSVGSVIKYLKCITKEDQGRLVVVTDKNIQYDSLYQGSVTFIKFSPSKCSQW